MTERQPVVIKAEPATLQVKTTAMATAGRDEHQLVIGAEERRGATEYHFSCSCGQFSGSHHTDRERIEQIHATHVAKKGAANG